MRARGCGYPWPPLHLAPQRVRFLIFIHTKPQNEVALWPDKNQDGAEKGKELPRLRVVEGCVAFRPFGGGVALL